MMRWVRAVWTWLRDDHVVFQDPAVERYFSRCTSCGRVFMHYWACVTAVDRERGRRVGCPCGGQRFRVCNIPVWQQVWFVLSRYIWRRLMKKEPFWDPRLALKKGA